MTYRVLVTGSRNWDRRDVIERELNAVLIPHAGWIREMTLVHGAAQGADAMAHQWAVTQMRLDRPVRIEAHRADWARDRGAAGIIRNTEMVKLGADLCLAFICPCDRPNCRVLKRSGPHGSHGATHCTQAAISAGIETRVFPWEEVVA